METVGLEGAAQTKGRGRVKGESEEKARVGRRARGGWQGPAGCKRRLERKGDTCHGHYREDKNLGKEWEI